MLWTKTMHVNFYINIIHFAPAVHFSFHSSDPTFFYISNKNWILNSSRNFHNSLIYNYLQIKYKSCLLICYFSYQKQFLSWKFGKIDSNQVKPPSPELYNKVWISVSKSGTWLFTWIDSKQDELSSHQPYCIQAS